MANPPQGNPPQGFTLGQLIEKTAEELRTLKKTPPENAVMQFIGCELELAVTVSAEAGGGIKFYVIDLSGKVSGEAVSRIKLTFGPLPGQVIAALGAAGGGPGPSPEPRPHGN